MQLLDSHVQAGQCLPADERGAYYAALVEYLYYGKEPEGLGQMATAVFVAIRPTLDVTRAKSASGKVGGSKRAGKREAKSDSACVSPTPESGEKRGKRNASEKEEEEEEGLTHTPGARTGAEGGGPDPLGEPAAHAPYAPPTPAEVAAFVAASGAAPIDAEAFCGWYGDHGWPPRDWRGSALRWSRQDRDRAAAGRGGSERGARDAVRDDYSRL